MFWKVVMVTATSSSSVAPARVPQGLLVFACSGHDLLGCSQFCGRLCLNSCASRLDTNEAELVLANKDELVIANDESTTLSTTTFLSVDAAP